MQEPIWLATLTVSVQAIEWVWLNSCGRILLNLALNRLHALEVAQRLERVSNLVSSKELDKIACKVGRLSNSTTTI